MDIDDKELFSSAMADEPISDVADTPAEAPVTETPQQDDRPRDEHGRFAPRTQAEPAPEPAPQVAATPQEAEDEGRVPPWRLREMRMERDDAIQRSHEMQRQLEMLQRQMPKPEPQPAPDLFENPTGAIDHRLAERLTPYEQQQQALRAEVQAIREENSRWRAESIHGPEAVREGYNWLVQNMPSDSNVMHLYNQMMQSRDPFGLLVQAHKEMSFVQQVRAAGGPDKWREQQLSQPSQQQASQERAGSRQVSNGQSQGSITKLPPSLRNAPSARGNGVDDDPSDMSDAALFRHAMR